MNEVIENTPTRPRRRIWRTLLWLLLALLLALALLIYATLKTGAGRELALAWLQRALPENALQWSRAEGHLTGGLVLHDVRYAAEGVDAQLARLELDLDAAALLSRRVHVRRLILNQGQIELPASAPSDEPWPQRLELPAQLPDLQLPVAIQIDALEARELRLTQAREPVLDIRSLDAGASLENGLLVLEDLQLDSDRLGLNLSGRFDSVKNWASQGRATAQLMLDDGVKLPLELVVAGDLQDLRLDAHAGEDAANRLQLNLQGGLENPQWTMQLQAPHLPPQWLGTATPLALELQGRGDLNQAELSGWVSHEGQRYELRPSRVSYADARVQVQPLAVGLWQGQVEVKGQIDLAQSEPHFDATLDWSQIVLPGSEAPASVVRTEGQARVQGPLSDYALNLQGQLEREGERVDLSLQGRGSLQAMDIAELQAKLPNGALTAKGRVDWEPQLLAQLEARLDRFDPSYFVADFPGAVNAAIRLDGGISDGQPWGQVQIDDLGGQLRDRRLDGAARIDAGRDGTGKADVDLRLGDSRIQTQGQWADDYALDAQLTPLNLADLLPDAAGRVQGRVELRGRRDAPDLTAHLEGQALSLGGQRITSARLQAQLRGWTQGEVDLKAQGLTVAEQDFDTLDLHLQGSQAQHQARLELRGPTGVMDVGLTGALADDGQWRAQLQQLQITPTDRSTWSLRTPGEFVRSADGAMSLTQTCLEALPSSVCAQIRASADGASEGEVRLKGVELSEFDPLLTGLMDQPMTIRGTLEARADFQRAADGRVQAQAELEVPVVDLRMDANAERSLLDLRQLRATLALDPAQARIVLDSAMGEGGHIRARLDNSNPMQSDGALSGELDLLLPDITALELFSDAVVDPRGRLQGRLGIAGTRAEPRLSGSLVLSEFSAEIPAIGIAPSEGEIRLSSDNASQATLDGRVKLGEGSLDVGGQFDLAAEGGAAMRITLKGDDLSVMNTPQVRVRASPDLRIEIAGKQMKLRGSVDVPWARVDLEHLQSATLPSSDEVIIDETTAGGGMSIDSNINITLGEDVRMNGYGLNGTLTGRLRVRDRPGRATTASGAIEVGGAYKAYGQDLTITRGRIAYSTSPLDNPSLDIRAQRIVDDVTVGIQVKGTALAPELTLWSRPMMEQAEQLSYLVLGRPLRSASQADGAQLSQAAAAMGGNLLAKNLGARMGLDEVGVSDNRALGGAALSVGKSLSPRLHLSYGVALFGSGQVVTLKYLLNRLWNIQIDSGTENRASFNYRLEK